MSSELTVPASGLVIPEGWEDPMENSALVQQATGRATPWLKIAYPGSEDKPAVVQPGQLFISTTGEIFPNGIELMLVEAKPGMRLNEGRWSPERVASCFSTNGWTPDGRGINPQPGPCRKDDGAGHGVVACPKAEWDRSGIKDRPPECSTTWTAVFWDPIVHRGVVSQFYNTSEKTMTFILRQIANRKNILSPDGRVPARYRARFRLTTKAESTYYVPQVEFLWNQPIPDEEIAAMMMELQWIKDEWPRLLTPRLPVDDPDAGAGSSSDAPY